MIADNFIIIIILKLIILNFHRPIYGNGLSIAMKSNNTHDHT